MNFSYACVRTRHFLTSAAPPAPLVLITSPNLEGVAGVS